MEDIAYYVMQVLNGQTYAHGPYSTEKARDNRLQNVHGGEVYPFSTFTRDPKRAVDEFKVEQIK